MVVIKKNPNGDTRTAPKGVTFEQFQEANDMHRADVRDVMHELATELAVAGNLRLLWRERKMIKANEILERLLSRWYVPRRDYAATLGALKDVNKALDKAHKEIQHSKLEAVVYREEAKSCNRDLRNIERECEHWRIRCEGYEDCLADIGLEFRKKGNNTWQLAKREPPQVQSCAIANKSESAAGAAVDYRYSLNSPPDYSKAYNVIPKQEG